MEINQLNTLQIDALKEVTNIGVGNAISDLSNYFDNNIQMTVPAVEIISLQNVYEVIGNPDNKAYAIFSQFGGELEGNIFFLLEKDIVEEFTKFLTQKVSTHSLVNQIGSIVSKSFINTLEEFTDLKIIQSPFQIAYDMVGAIVEQGFIEYCEISNEVILVVNSFILDEKNLKGYFIFFPNPIYLPVLFNKLGVSDNED